jgi:hypothetical protein
VAAEVEVKEEVAPTTSSNITSPKNLVETVAMNVTVIDVTTASVAMIDALGKLAKEEANVKISLNFNKTSAIQSQSKPQLRKMSPYPTVSSIRR